MPNPGSPSDSGIGVDSLSLRRDPAQAPVTTPEATLAPRELVVLTLGYTLTDRAGDYVPTADGYRQGAKQHTITITVPAADAPMTAADWAEAAFIATNVDTPENCTRTPGVQAISNALAEWWDTFEHASQDRPGVAEFFPAPDHEGRRSISVGDTVAVTTTDRATARLACSRAGWSEVTR